MVNQQFGQSNDPYWYPQLPDGYNDHRQHQGGPVPMPSSGHGQQANFNTPTQSFPSGMHGFPPSYGRPSQSFPSFPGHGGGPSPSFPPSQQHGGNIAPQGPPPEWTPEYPAMQAFAIDPGAIAGCMYRFTYVWLSRRQGFWFFPVFVGPRSVAGYRWNSRRRRWEYTGIDLNQINSFTCI